MRKDIGCPIAQIVRIDRRATGLRRVSLAAEAGEQRQAHGDQRDQCAA